MQAVHTEGPHDVDEDRALGQAGVAESLRHGEDARAQGGLDQVDERLQIAADPFGTL